MCLILTLMAALAATLFWYRSAERETLKLGFLSLMYWSAALMWTVDGIFSVAEGGSFVTVTVDDALLGALVIACGIGAWIVLVLREKRKTAGRGA